MFSLECHRMDQNYQNRGSDWHFKDRIRACLTADQTRPFFYSNHNGVRIYSNAKNVTEILIFSSEDIIVEDVDGAYANGMTHIVWNKFDLYEFYLGALKEKQHWKECDFLI